MSTPKGPDKPECCPECEAIIDKFGDCICSGKPTDKPYHSKSEMRRIEHMKQYDKPPAQVGGKEWWIDSVGDTVDDCFDAIVYAKNPMINQCVHVIEKSAHDAVCRELDKVNEANKYYRGAFDLRAGEVDRLERELAEANQTIKYRDETIPELRETIDKLRAENEAAAELISTAEQRGYLSGKAYFEKDLHAARAESHALCFTISETQGALNRANEEIANLKAQLVVEDLSATFDKVAMIERYPSAKALVERIASLEKALEFYAHGKHVSTCAYTDELLIKDNGETAREALGKK